MRTPTSTRRDHAERGRPRDAARRCSRAGGVGFESSSWPLPALDPERVALIGARSVDPGERDALREAGVAVFTIWTSTGVASSRS